MRVSLSISRLLAGVALTLFILAGPSASAQKSVRLVCDIWPPYQTLSSSGYSGLSVDIVRAVYSRLGVTEVEITSRPWKRALAMVRFGDAEGLFSANRTPDREDHLLYPDEPLLQAPWVIWTRDDLTIHSLDDLKGRTVGVVLGYSYTPEFWDFIEKYCIVERVHNDDINFRKVAQGRIDATIAELGNGLILAAEVGGVHPNAEPVIKEDGLYIVFNPALVSEKSVSEFSRALKQFKTTPEYRALLEKYLGTTH